MRLDTTSVLKGKPCVFACLLLAISFTPSSRAQVESRDVVVYGSTPAGIVAAIQLRELGHTVLLLEPSEHFGGMTTGGLGATDIGNKQVIGGMAREFYRRVLRHYESESAWRFQKRDDYKGAHQKPGETSQWTFEPRAAESIYRNWIETSKVELRINTPLDRSKSVEKTSQRIVKIPLMDGKWIAADFFIDASYEGDLMAMAAVSYTIGREANAMYSETLNGVQFAQSKKHQFMPSVSPYRTATDPKSGLLPGISSEPQKPDGSMDSHVQAYCLRMTLTDFPENRIPFERPEGYREEDYELLFRNFEAGLKQVPWHSIGMPNRKTDTNNNTGFSTDFIGMSDRWPEADDAERKDLYQQHLRYQQGLCWTLANHQRVPTAIRAEAAKWGLSRDEFVQHGGWSPQLYVREARRMIGAVVMNEQHCRGTLRVDDSVGMAAYTMDSHNVQRIVGADGFVQNEGDVQVGGFPPFSISYRSIIPKREQCTNLVVPVCLSASHIAYGSIRMEPVFMVLGQSAADAVHLAIKNQQAIQDVRYDELKTLLDSQGQVLTY